ncbi:inositol-trisphosphate 3-kinase B-like [Alosa sapidissima]|uniref:inositol-trisphosphate 3-kinase B-like n=1 Tax=Alosa sapidissima TaxID=34773 RepID=UPI001C0A1A10|nr:inositol-trisphosphate 3-kinase B-like [Alosa sapidissima]
MSVTTSPSVSVEMRRGEGERRKLPDTVAEEGGIVCLLEGHPHEEDMSGIYTAVLQGPRATPMLQSAQAVLSPRADDGEEGEPDVIHTPEGSPHSREVTHTPPVVTGELTHTPEHTGVTAHLPQTHTPATHDTTLTLTGETTHTQQTNTPVHPTSHTAPGPSTQEGRVLEEGGGGGVEAKEDGEREKEGGMQWTERKEAPRRNLWSLRERGMNERRNEGRREWPRGGSLERTSQEGRGMGWRRGGKMWKEHSRDGEVEDGERDEARSVLEEEKRRVKETPHHHILSRVLVHSSTSSSSSSSSFNFSSPESDEVFSEGEETSSRRRIMRRCRSWRTFLTMMQWSKRRQSSWVQLAGHQGNFQLSEGGEVLKRWSETEGACLSLLMSDVLRVFVPRYYGPLSRNGNDYLRLEDLLSGLTHPVIMDCKMGVRTYLEEEIAKARMSHTLRNDMYQKMVKVDPSAPLAEEHAQGAVTKLRYMQWRDSVSSSSTLGFRIEGIMLENGTVLRDFNRTQSIGQLIDAFLTFTKSNLHILRAYQSRLQALSDVLHESEFFNTHELIGSSLLFVHDSSSKANVWMIDFGKSMPTPEGIHLQHDVAWAEGNREDGYLIGLASINRLLAKAIRQAQGSGLERSDSQTLAGDGEDEDEEENTQSVQYGSLNPAQ